MAKNCKIILILFFLTVSLFGKISPVAQAAFSDVFGPDLTTPINFLQEREIVNGYPDGTFRPFQRINRAELLKIIIESAFPADEIERALDDYRAKGYSYADYQDVPINAWYAPYVRVATKYGIINGYPDGTFRPSQNVIFVEALKIAALANGWEVAEDPVEWYRNFVLEAEKRKVIPIVIWSFGQQITRSEMADMITRFIKEKEGNLDEYRSSISGYNKQVTYDCLRAGQCPVIISTSEPAPLSQTQNDNNTSYEINTREEFILNASKYTNDKEKISFIVNKRLAELYPNWQANAKNLINEYNKILALTTNKQLEIGKFVILEDANDMCRAQEHPDFFLSNGVYGGLTIFYLVSDLPMPLACPIFFNGTISTVNDQQYGIAYLTPAYDSNIEQPNEYILGNLAHEVGHAYGLGIPEYYQYFEGFLDNPSGLKIAQFFKDITGVAPDLGDYKPFFAKESPNDPMSSAEPIPYNALNSFIINHNGNHAYHLSTISNMIKEMKVLVRVRDEKGGIATNLPVKVFGIKANTYPSSYEDDNNQKIIETVYTDDEGLAEVSLPANTVIYGDPYNINRKFLIKAVKVNFNGKSAGAYFSAVDLLYKFLVEGEEAYNIDLTLR